MKIDNTSFNSIEFGELSKKAKIAYNILLDMAITHLGKDFELPLSLRKNDNGYDTALSYTMFANVFPLVCNDLLNRKCCENKHIIYKMIDNHASSVEDVTNDYQTVLVKWTDDNEFISYDGDFDFAKIKARNGKEEKNKTAANKEVKNRELKEKEELKSENANLKNELAKEKIKKQENDKKALEEKTSTEIQKLIETVILRYGKFTPNNINLCVIELYRLLVDPNA